MSQCSTHDERSVGELHIRDYGTTLCSLNSACFQDYAKEDTSIFLSYYNTLLDISPSQACKDFPPAEESLFCFPRWIFNSETKDFIALRELYIHYCLALCCLSYSNMTTFVLEKCFQQISHNGRYSKGECHWGVFYRPWKAIASHSGFMCATGEDKEELHRGLFSQIDVTETKTTWASSPSKTSKEETTVCETQCRGTTPNCCEINFKAYSNKHVVAALYWWYRIKASSIFGFYPFFF